MEISQAAAQIAGNVFRLKFHLLGFPLEQGVRTLVVKIPGNDPSARNPHDNHESHHDTDPQGNQLHQARFLPLIHYQRRRWICCRSLAETE